MYYSTEVITRIVKLICSLPPIWKYDTGLFFVCFVIASVEAALLLLLLLLMQNA